VKAARQRREASNPRPTWATETPDAPPAPAFGAGRRPTRTTADADNTRRCSSSNLEDAPSSGGAEAGEESFVGMQSALQAELEAMQRTQTTKRRGRMT